jgi:cell division protein FtsQ
LHNPGRGVRLDPQRRRPIEGEVMMDEATARRLRRVRFRRVAIAAAVISVLPIAVASYLSPTFRVGDVEVVGTTQVDAAQVEQLASLDGDSMFRLDSTGAEKRIGYLPLIKSVTIERRWPNTVRIVVNERQPWAYWQVGDQKYVIDSEGIVLADLPPAEGAPTVKDLTNPVRLVPGDHVDRDAVALTYLLLQRVPEVLAWNPAGFEYTTDKGLALLADVGYRVVIGDSQNIEYKLAVWKKIEESLGRAAMSGHVLDLRFENRPAFH